MENGSFASLQLGYIKSLKRSPGFGWLGQTF